MLRYASKLIISFAMLVTATSASALDQVTLQLKWTHAFQFAGYYAAKELGYYREAGLDVRFEEGRPGFDPVRNVLDGKADFGIGTSSLLLQRKAGQPIVVLASIFQHSPYALIARQQNAAQSIHDIIGKRLMLEPQADELIAFLKKEGIPINRMQRIEHSFDLQDLIKGNVDVMSAYVTNELYYLNLAHFPYYAYTPRSVGIDFYGDTLFTTEAEIAKNPGRVKAFRAASLRGWKYAMAHPKEIAELIFAKYSQQHPLDFYLFEARQMIPLIQSEIIEMGYVNPGRWRYIADIYAEMGMLPNDFSLNGFLYDPDPHRDLTWLYRALAAALIVISVIAFIALYIHRINRRLAVSLADMNQVQRELANREKLYRLLVENMRDVVWILDPVSLRFRYVSPSVQQLRGYTPDEIMSKPMDDVLIPESAATLKEKIKQNTADFLSGENPDQTYCEELAQLCKDGSTVWTEVIAKYYLNGENGQVEIHGVTRDITERKHKDDELKESETRLRTLFETTSDAVMLLDEKGFFDCNPATLGVFGCASKEEFCSKHPDDLSPPEQPCGTDSMTLANQRIANAFKSGREHFEWMHKRLDTSQVFPADVLLNAMSINGRPFLQAVVRDITERKMAEERIKHLAFYDALTGLPNRRMLNDRLSQKLAVSKRSGLYGAIMVLDLDNFKPLNDQYGHATGDLLLMEVARRLTNCLREVDTVARFGGDEFVVMLGELDESRDTSKAQAAIVAEKIRFTLSEAYFLKPYQEEQTDAIVEHHCTSSIGVALFGGEANQDEIFRYADAAMYQAKEAGRNLIRFYDNRG